VDDHDVQDTLLLKIVELCVTVRGFSLASGWLEKYKQLTRKSMQRRKVFVEKYMIVPQRSTI